MNYIATDTPSGNKEIQFDSPPNHNEYLEAVNAVCGGVHRCLHISADKLTYVVQPVNIQAELIASSQSTADNHICQVTLRCDMCQSVFTGYQLLNKRMFKPGPYHRHIPHCPNCPPVNVQDWLVSTVRLTPNKPELVAEIEYQPRYTAVKVSQEELDEFV